NRRRLDRRHEPEPALRLGKPPPGPVLEADVPLVPRALARGELKAPGDVERARSLLRPRVHADLERRGRRHELGDRADGLEVRPLACDRGLALRADRDERRPRPEPDLAPAVRTLRRARAQGGRILPLIVRRAPGPDLPERAA